MAVRELASAAGFSHVTRVLLENPFNNLYELRAEAEATQADTAAAWYDPGVRMENHYRQDDHRSAERRTLRTSARPP